MGAGQVAAILGVSLLVIVTPGQDTALTIRTRSPAAARGLGAFGVVSGGHVGPGDERGLAAVPLPRSRAFTALRLAGATYLVLLVVQALVALFALAVGGSRRPRTRPLRDVPSGTLSNLGNAKVAVFFTSLLPQFAPVVPDLLDDAPLGLSSPLDADLADRLRRRGRQGANVLLRPCVRRALDACTGAVLVSLGLRLAVER